MAISSIVRILGPVLAAGFLFGSVGQADRQKIDRLWALDSLVGEERFTLRQTLDRLAGTQPLRDEDRLALGILYVHLHLRDPDLEHARRAEDHLRGIENEPLKKEPLTLVYLGMASSFKARAKTLFGVTDLENMKACFEAIPEDHPDWFIRFLRGTTYLQVGKNLPHLRYFADFKTKAVHYGRNDLLYVLDRYAKHPLEEFRLETYDLETDGVPLAIKKRCEAALGSL
ncbi:MAG: hypothetical protein JW747_07875 [Candidatus Aminicenantes bacterium]|nr:hypothetical protein [Candidatus Aminicenantes bacterium]